ncbi:MAG: hypothetical protein ACM3X7_09505 [Solirubrobacterales bacterium]
MDFMALQEIIKKIDGVINAKIITEDNQITELHILANNLRAAKQIVRDIESSLMAVFDYRIDRRVISIAQIETDERKNINRIKFHGVALSTNGDQVDCAVKLFLNDEEFSSMQTAVKTEKNKRKVVAISTIKTVEELIGSNVSLDVQDVFVQSSGETSFATVIVNMINNNREETMIGTALVKSDVNEAIAKAALDAVNRRIERK